jgi:aspartyl-tRNA(Asn)/glutamyl-tRNA(Gln) amidotransferase subunit A
MTPIELGQLGITKTLQLIRTHQLSPVELVHGYLARIEQLNPTLNVYLTVLAESALAARRPQSELSFKAKN